MVIIGNISFNLPDQLLTLAKILSTKFVKIKKRFPQSHHIDHFTICLNKTLLYLFADLHVSEI